VVKLLATVPQAAGGSLTVAPGTTFKAGFDFTMPESHSTATVHLLSTRFTFT
jgi:hypothetical protein